MKTFKRNAVIITVLMFVCLAVYLNWAYNSKGSEEASQVDASADIHTDDQQTQNTDKTNAEETGLFYTADETDDSARETAITEYFDSVRISRAQARDSAVSTLTMVSESDAAAQDTVDEALAKISTMAEYTVLESEVESIIKTKGFDDCVVYITEDGINVTVPASESGLSEADVARITDVVTTSTDFTAAQLKITEVR